MKNNKNYQRPVFRLTVLVISLYAVQSSVYAMQALDDKSLSNVNGQDGLHVNLDFKELDVGTFFWEDKAGRGSNGKTGDTTLRAEAENFKIQSHSSTPTVNPNIDIQINSGSKQINQGWILIWKSPLY